MSHLFNTKRQSIETTSPGDPGGENENEKRTDSNTFIGKDGLLQDFYRQLKQFKEWNDKRDWLAFHHHHYDWWMFPIDEISSRGNRYQLNENIIKELQENKQFIEDLRCGVRLMVRSWGWDIDKAELFNERDEKQKWSYWPVRLYKAGKCMWLFKQNDYYQSLRKYAFHIKNVEKEKLDYFSHIKNGKANVIEMWDQMEQK